MVLRSPLVIISGVTTQLPPGDVVPGSDTIALASGNAGIALGLQALASGNVAQASGNAGISVGLTALASGNAGIAVGLQALASGNAALANEAAISGYALVPSGAFGGASASLVLLHDTTVGSTVNLSGQGGLQIQQVNDVITISGGTGAGGGGGAVGSGTEQAFFLNVIQISGSYTIPSGFNAGTFGPVDVLSGVTVTTPSGSTWTVV